MRQRALLAAFILVDLIVQQHWVVLSNDSNRFLQLLEYFLLVFLLERKNNVFLHMCDFVKQQIEGRLNGKVEVKEELVVLYFLEGLLRALVLYVLERLEDRLLAEALIVKDLVVDFGLHSPTGVLLLRDPQDGCLHLRVLEVFLAAVVEEQRVRYRDIGLYFLSEDVLLVTSLLSDLGAEFPQRRH